MIRIAGLQPLKSYAPELHAMAAWLESKPTISLTIVRTPEEAYDAATFDAVYLKMGYAPIWRTTALPEVHDYSSASVGTLANLKHVVKSQLSRRPVLRSFLSEYVKQRFRFSDTTPFVLRDMGVPDSFLRAASTQKSSAIYDLFYAGSITRARKTESLLRAVQHAGLSILVAGKPDDDIYSEFKSSSRVTFAGPVPHAEIPSLASQCKFGMNLTPDITPYNRQTSTKVLEYLAMGLPVVTNDYGWVRGFEAETGARLIKIPSLDQLSSELLAQPYAIPDMSRYRWSSVFERSGIYQALLNVL